MLRRAAWCSSEDPQPVGHRFERLASSTDAGISGKMLGPPMAGFKQPETASIESRIVSASRRLGFHRQSRRLSGSTEAACSFEGEDIRTVLELTSKGWICFVLQRERISS